MIFMRVWLAVGVKYRLIAKRATRNVHKKSLIMLVSTAYFFLLLCLQK